MTNENWRQIKDTDYEVSDLGRVRRADSGEIVKANVWGKSMWVNMKVNGRWTGRPVHKLVIEAFVGPRPKGMNILHWNDERSDNRLANLRYGTQSENVADWIRNHEAKGHVYYARAYRRAKTRYQEVRVRQLRDAVWAVQDGDMTLKEAGKTVGLSESAMCRIVKGNRRGYVTNRQSETRFIIEHNRKELVIATYGLG